MARGRGAGTETKKITGGRGKKGAARDAAMKIGVESGGGVRRHQDDWLRTGLAQEAVGWGCLSAALITLSVGLTPPTSFISQFPAHLAALQATAREGQLTL